MAKSLQLCNLELQDSTKKHFSDVGSLDKYEDNDNIIINNTTYHTDILTILIVTLYKQVNTSTIGFPVSPRPFRTIPKTTERVTMPSRFVEGYFS